MRSGATAWLPGPVFAPALGTSSFTTSIARKPISRPRIRTTATISMCEDPKSQAEMYKQFADMLNVDQPNASENPRKNKPNVIRDGGDSADDGGGSGDGGEMAAEKTGLGLKPALGRNVQKAVSRKAEINPADYSVFDSLLKKSGGSGQKPIKGSKAFMSSNLAKKVLRKDGKISKDRRIMADALKSESPIAPDVVQQPPAQEQSSFSQDEAAAGYAQMADVFGDSIHTSRNPVRPPIEPVALVEKQPVAELKRPPRRPGMVPEETMRSSTSKSRVKYDLGEFDDSIPSAEVDWSDEPPELLAPPQRPGAVVEDGGSDGRAAVATPRNDVSELTEEEIKEGYELMANTFGTGSKARGVAEEVVQAVEVEGEVEEEKASLLKPPVRNVDESPMETNVSPTPADTSNLTEQEKLAGYDLMAKEFGTLQRSTETADALDSASVVEPEVKVSLDAPPLRPKPIDSDEKLDSEEDLVESKQKETPADTKGLTEKQIREGYDLMAKEFGTLERNIDSGPEVGDTPDSSSAIADPEVKVSLNAPPLRPEPVDLIIEQEESPSELISKEGFDEQETTAAVVEEPAVLMSPPPRPEPPRSNAQVTIDNISKVMEKEALELEDSDSIDATEDVDDFLTDLFGESESENGFTTALIDTSDSDANAQAIFDADEMISLLENASKGVGNFSASVSSVKQGQRNVKQRNEEFSKRRRRSDQEVMVLRNAKLVHQVEKEVQV